MERKRGVAKNQPVEATCSICNRSNSSRWYRTDRLFDWWICKSCYLKGRRMQVNDKTCFTCRKTNSYTWYKDSVGQDICLACYQLDFNKKQLLRTDRKCNVCNSCKTTNWYVDHEVSGFLCLKCYQIRHARKKKARELETNKS
jgi:hypothetical protein